MNTTNQVDGTFQLFSQGGTFHIWDEELSLLVENSDLNTAYALLLEERQRVLAKRDRLGIGSSLAALGPPRRQLKRHLPFFIKAATVALVGVVLLSAASISFNYALRGEAVRHVAQKGARTLIANMTKGIERFSEKDMTPDRVERLRLALRGAVPKLRPFVNELRPLFDDPQRGGMQ